MSSPNMVYQGVEDGLDMAYVYTLIEMFRASIKLPSRTHSCQMCSIQEMDPLLFAETDDGSEYHYVLKYRGTQVLRGAECGCDFFQELIMELEPELSKRGYNADNAHGLKFRPQRWICELCTFSSWWWGAIEWKSVESELPATSSSNVAIREKECYSFVANRGKQPSVEVVVVHS